MMRAFLAALICLPVASCGTSAGDGSEEVVPADAAGGVDAPANEPDVGQGAPDLALAPFDAAAGESDLAAPAPADAGASNTDAADAGVGPGQWQSLPAMPGGGRPYAGVAAAGGRVFVVGGSGNGPESREVTAFDPRSGTWQAIAPLPDRFPMPNVAAAGDRLFVLGALGVTTTLEYDAAGNTWLPRTPAPVSRGRGAAAVAVRGAQILIAGGVIPGKSATGVDINVRVPEVLAYDTAADRWAMLPDLVPARGYAMGAVTADDVLFVMGGSTDFARTADVMLLDLRNPSTWRPAAVLPVTLSSAAVAVLAGRIYLFGGVVTAAGSISPATYFRDPATGYYREAAPMRTPRFATGAAVIDGRAYIPGGIAPSADGMTAAPVSTLEVFIP
jgi:N-acetylneuraminic acid mutarotase